MWSIQGEIPSSVNSLIALFPWGQGMSHDPRMRGYSLQALGAGLGFSACRMGRIGVAGKVWALGSPRTPPQGMRRLTAGDSGERRYRSRSGY